jgi:hypothetical protein
MEQDFWRRFIGRSRKRLAQAINFVYPGDSSWQSDPTPIVSSLFPVDEAARLLDALKADDTSLNEAESSAIARMRDLFAGKYQKTFE